MDVRNWGLNQIMQLPDHCFGRRWPIIIAGEGAEAPAWILSAEALPERCVIWSARMSTGVMVTASTHALLWRAALGDQLPTTQAEFTALDQLFGRQGDLAVLVGQYYTVFAASHWTMRMPLLTGGRRVIMEVAGAAVTAKLFTFMIEVSSIPNEVPDCLLSV